MSLRDKLIRCLENLESAIGIFLFFQELFYTVDHIISKKNQLTMELEATTTNGFRASLIINIV